MIKNPLISKIKEIYDDLSPVETTIANFLLSFTGSEIPSSKEMASSLFVSEASLTRFAKKCGYKGLRELSFSYASTEKSTEICELNAITQNIAGSYQLVLDRTISVIDEAQLKKITDLIINARRIFIFGLGNSGIAAREYELRLLRIGLYVDAIDESHLMRVTSALMNDECLVIALSISGTTKELLTALKLAKKHNARVVMLTTAGNRPELSFCDEIMQIGSLKDLNYGTAITPQLPLLFMLDIFYYSLMQFDGSEKRSIFSRTTSALIDDNAETKHRSKEHSEAGDTE